MLRLLSSSIGKKLVMAVTGVALLGFLVAHMAGNLTLYLGQDSLNGYAATLKGNPLLWPARLGLLTVFGLHVATGISLARENRNARPIRYDRVEPQTATWASRYIVFTGLVVLFFVVFHLLHFTIGAVQSEVFHGVDAQGRHDVYGMVTGAFSNPIVSGVYVLAMAVLGFHLYHAVQSAVQTLGFAHKSYKQTLEFGAKAIVALIVIGNCSFPVFVLAGLVG
ncbi:MAG: succinate dehydrogenase cytochrome b subunit [Myxococcota bacterium]